MGPVTQSLSLYRELAEWYERLGQTTMRDRFLMLAADAAMQLGQPEEADRLRLRLLQGSRHHMLRPYSSWAEASAAPDVQAYLRDLRLNYPQETAEKLLAGLKQGQGSTPPAQPQPQPQPKREAPPQRPIPYTAPLVDINGPAEAPPRQRPRVAAPLAEPYPLVDDRPAPAPKAPPPRQARPAAPLPVEEKRRPEKGPPNGASWMSLALMLLMSLAALAVAAWTLGRPFLPETWLR